jgi:hypothetical protein
VPTVAENTTKIVRAHFSGTYPEEIDMVAEMDALISTSTI